MASTQTAKAVPARRAGRPPLSESRKAQTRLKIATAAVRLFAEHGVDGTSAAQIADAVGISLRTLWRYCPSKEECVAPLLTTGLDRLVESLRRWPADRALADAADDAGWFADSTSERVRLTVQLMRIARTEPALAAVWTRVYSEAVAPIAAVLAARGGCAPDELRVKVRAAMLVAALHHGMRDYVWRPAGRGGPSLEDTVRAAARIAFAAIEIED